MVSTEGTVIEELKNYCINIPEEIYIHILNITNFKAADLKSLKLSCRLFNTIVNECIVLVVASIATWESHDWTYDKIYSTKRIILVLSLSDYVTNEAAAFVKRLLSQRLKGTVKFEVWFTDVEKAITFHNCKQEPCEHHDHANLEKQDYLNCNNYVLYNQCCLEHKSYTNLISVMTDGYSSNFCENHNVPYLATSQPSQLNTWIKTKCDLLTLFEGTCWNTSKVLVTRNLNNGSSVKVEKVPGFIIHCICVKQITSKFLVTEPNFEKKEKNYFKIFSKWTKKNTTANVAVSRLQDQ